MLTTKRKPAGVGEILIEEFMKPIGLTQSALAEAMGVQRKHVNELCNERRAVTAPTALILARVFGNSPDFWLNVQRRGDLWKALHSPRERKRIERARPPAIRGMTAHGFRSMASTILNEQGWNRGNRAPACPCRAGRGARRVQLHGASGYGQDCLLRVAQI